ncbi:hypothetical protein AB0O28_27570 [Microbispora sp. NPDC088329]|uniref:hypothetical protein n=1 Tax=Microbispora sp. NPDC088329 TaxID=3154869 RepID=UPI00342C1B67
MAESADTGHAHRVLQSGGRISPQFRWLNPERTDDPREVLEKEGLIFDHAGRADPQRRVTADRFRTMLAQAGVVLPPAGGPEPTPPPDPAPAAFDNLSIPVELFERVHYRGEPVGETFRAHLERHFAFLTFQNPEKIKEGFAYVSTVNLWVKVAEVLTGQDAKNPITADGVRARLREIAWRRNNIAHTADHDPVRPGQKAPITADEAEATIEWLETMAIAIQLALGDTLPAPSPGSPGEMRGAPSAAGVRTSARLRDQLESAGYAKYPSLQPRTERTIRRGAKRRPAYASRLRRTWWRLPLVPQRSMSGLAALASAPFRD